MSTHPNKEDAERLAKEYGKEGIIIFHFKGLQFGYASYGKTKELCRAFKSLSDKIYRIILQKGKNL